MDDWTLKLENGGQIDVIYTDFEKAFDKVSHKRLIYNYTVMGLTQMTDVILWIEAFLTNRKQWVQDSRSMPITLTGQRYSVEYHKDLYKAHCYL